MAILKRLLLLLHTEKKSLNEGQALLVVILVLVVALTIGLSIAVRTTTNLRTSSEDDNSERAFSAAEAGIEQALLSNSSVPQTSLANRTSYQTTVSTISGGEFILNNGTTVLKDEPTDVWLSTYPGYASPWSGNLIINWGAATDTCTPAEANNTQAALEVIVITGSAVNPRSTTYVFDPCSTRASANNFELVSNPGNTINGKTFSRSRTLNISSGLLARVIPLYASSGIAVQKSAADPPLPSQGTIVTSVGSAGETQRKIVSYRSNPKLPVELFPFIIFSPR